MPAERGVPEVRRLVLASRNPAKLVELRRLLPVLARWEVLTLDDLPGYTEPVEDGESFEANALLKARAAAAATGLPTLAEDSGLCVDSLGGMPGVLSARWSGTHGDDEANLRLVLAQLHHLPDGPRRAARFVCVAALVVPGVGEELAQGVLEGRLARAPRGHHGFGYDPIFLPAGSRLTTGELAPAAKDAISHRGSALRALSGALARLGGSPG